MSEKNEYTNDIDALLDALTPSASGFGDVEMHRTDALRSHAALTALVAERDALRKRVAELERDVDMLREDAHKWKKMYDCHYESERIWISRVVELERQVKSPADRDRDRELRERLVCAALTGVIAGKYGSEYESAAIYATRHADAVLERMEGGDA